MGVEEQTSSLNQPLLAAQAEDPATMRTAVSDCKLQDKCFLSVGASESSDGYKKVQRKLLIACVLCFIFMVIEVVGGYIAKSVAIMSDAAHMLSDVSAFLVSIFAAWAATQPSSWHYSFGYHRAEILGALVSVLTIWAVTGALVFEAVQRTINPVRVDGKLMFIISVAGVCFNILIALALGVHAHLGHSHGPGGCSGHGHSHDHGGHSHSHEHGGHSHSHEHGHSHDHGKGCKHKHDENHAHGSSNGHVHAGGSCGHSHSNHDHSHHDHSSHDHDHSQHNHNHSHHDHSHSHASSSSSSSNSGEDDSNTPLLAEQQQAAAGAAATSAAAWTASDAAEAGAGDAGGGGVRPTGSKDCIIIDLPATAGPGANCGLAGHAVSCRCTISRTGSHEIEVRCELPSAAAAIALKSSGRPSSSHGHSHRHDHDHGQGNAGSINLRSAVLHVIGDILQSIGVAIAGALIWYNQDDPRWYIADPICTFIFSVVVLLTTKSILRDIIHVLMERTPTDMDIPAMSQVISDMEGVRDVHDLHIWNISTSTSPVLTAHVHIGPDADANIVLQKLEQYVRGVGIQHSTIQICNPLQAAAP